MAEMKDAEMKWAKSASFNSMNTYHFEFVANGID